MKTYWQRLTRSLVLLALILTAAAVNSEAQTLRPRQPAQYGIIPMFTNNPAAMFVITNLLQEPMPELSVPAVSQAASAPGTYWTLKGAPVPLPFNEVPLVDCIYNATKSTYGGVPIPTPENKDIYIFGNGFRYHYTNVITSKIYLIGYPGLEVDRTDGTLNSDTTYAAPKNVE